MTKYIDSEKKTNIILFSLLFKKWKGLLEFLAKASKFLEPALTGGYWIALPQKVDMFFFRSFSFWFLGLAKKDYIKYFVLFFIDRKSFYMFCFIVFFTCFGFIIYGHRIKGINMDWWSWLWCYFQVLEDVMW